MSRRPAGPKAMRSRPCWRWALRSTARKPVETIIEAGGTAHRIVFRVDQVRQEPRIDHQMAPSKVKTGTSVRLHWPHSACYYIEDAEQRFLQIADDFAWFNPHVTITAEWNGARRVERRAT